MCQWRHEWSAVALDINNRIKHISNTNSGICITIA